MLISSETPHDFRCPFRGGANCIGTVCAAWRQATATHGYCGAGGAPSPAAASAPAATAATSRPDIAPAKTTRGSR